MMKSTRRFCLIGVSALLVGCATAHSPVTGFIYSEVQSGVGATANQVGNRVGSACATSYLGVVATGDASIEQARKNGGITQISSVDASSENILMFWAKYCTIVRGR